MKRPRLSTPLCTQYSMYLVGDHLENCHARQKNDRQRRVSTRGFGIRMGPFRCFLGSFSDAQTRVNLGTPTCAIELIGVSEVRLLFAFQKRHNKCKRSYSYFAILELWRGAGAAWSVLGLCHVSSYENGSIYCMDTKSIPRKRPWLVGQKSPSLLRLTNELREPASEGIVCCNQRIGTMLAVYATKIGAVFWDWFSWFGCRQTFFHPTGNKCAKLWLVLP